MNEEWAKEFNLSTEDVVKKFKDALNDKNITNMIRNLGINIKDLGDQNEQTM